MADQINIFVDNKPGSITKITKILNESSINMRAIVIADRDSFGIIKMLVDNPQKALLTLSSAGYACALKKVLAVIISDQPGGLNALTATLSDFNINILDAYGFVIESKKKAAFCVEVKEYENVKQIVESKNFRVLADNELYEL
jgi:hypothetical protein